MKFKIFNLKQIKNNNKKISFISNRAHLNIQSNSCPTPIVKTIPKWYKNADIFAINPQTDKPWIDPKDGGKIPTWKSCPAIFDIMSTGYVLKTPCDIEFYFDKNNNKISVKILDPMCQDFVSSRFPLPQFHHPDGYYEDHFAWWSDWAVEVPEGYSVLYCHPFNRFELPFLSTSGIVDNDKVPLLGTMPFFIRKGWSGIINAGTPYMQIFPFKRENWESKIILENPEKIYEKNINNSKKYRVKNGGVYKNQVWEKRFYR